MKYFIKIALIIGCLALTASVSAGVLTVWSGWTEFATEDTADSGNYYLNPGYGGQAFDAERLFYKVSGGKLFLGLQSGFDLVDGHQLFGTGNYYAGDLALSFNGVTLGTSSTYEYGVDFGLYTKDYLSVGEDVNNTIGQVNTASGALGVDPQGMYSVTAWNDRVYAGHVIANPFAIDEGSLHTSLQSNTAGSEGSSFYRMVSFNIGTLDLSDVDVHWTMSCGNDAINGHFSVVPEPSLLSLMGLGLLGLGFVRRRKAKA